MNFIGCKNRIGLQGRELMSLKMGIRTQDIFIIKRAKGNGETALEECGIRREYGVTRLTILSVLLLTIIGSYSLLAILVILMVGLLVYKD